MEIDTQKESSAYIDGIVHCDIKGFGSNVQKIVVELEGNVEHDGWNIVITPTTLIFEPLGPETQNFEVTITASDDLSSDLTSTVTIRGTATLEPGATSYDVDPAYATVRVKPFMLCLCTGDMSGQGEPGDMVKFYIKLENKGNYDA